MFEKELENSISKLGSSELEKKYLTFCVEGQTFGISISLILQIVKMQEITTVPEFPSYAKGIINLRGLVIPVIDMRLRLNKSEKEYNERTCIVVASIGEKYFGFIVDDVEEVIDIPKENISAPPTLSTSGDSFISGIAKLEDKVCLLLSLEKLICTKDFHAVLTEPN